MALVVPPPELAPIRAFPNPTNVTGQVYGISMAALGTSRLAVGAQDVRIGNVNAAGAVYVFDFATAALLNTIPSPQPAVGGRFGGDISAIDSTRLLVGSREGSATAQSDGVAYVVDINSGAVTATVPNPRAGHLDNFGFALDYLGNNRAIVGAYRDDEGAFDTGAAHIINTTTGATLFSLNNPTPASEDFFGFAATAAGRFALLGASLDNTAATDAGAVYVYDVTAAPVFTRTLLNPNPTTVDRFGASIAPFATDKALIGAQTNDFSAQNAGSAYLYNVANGQLLQTFHHPEPIAEDQFGAGLAGVLGQYAVIGAPNRNSGRGAAYVFRVDTGEWIATIPNPDPTNVGNFGFSILEVPGGVLVGGFGNRGGVFLYQIPEPNTWCFTLLSATIAFATFRRRT